MTGAFDLAPAVSNLLTGVLGGDETIKALFGDDGKGTASGTLDRFGLGAVSNEPGNQPGYPASNVNRNMFRISAVFNCTMFGVPVEPGCLLDVISPRSAGSEAGRRQIWRRAARGKTPRGRRGGRTRLPLLQVAAPIRATRSASETSWTTRLPNLPGLDGGRDKGPKARGADQAAQDLLDFLFRP